MNRRGFFQAAAAVVTAVSLPAIEEPLRYEWQEDVLQKLRERAAWNIAYPTVVYNTDTRQSITLDHIWRAKRCLERREPPSEYIDLFDISQFNETEV